MSTASLPHIEAHLIDAATLVCRALDFSAHGLAVVRTDGSLLAQNRTLQEWTNGAPIDFGDPDVIEALVDAAHGQTCTLDNVELFADRTGPWRLQVMPFAVGAAATVLIEDGIERTDVARAFEDSERRFRLLVDCANDGIAVHRGGILLYVNPAALKMLGYRADEVVGRPVLEFVHPDHHQAVKQRLEALSRGQAAPLRQESFVRKDGTELAVEASASRAPFAGGDVNFVFFRDVSQQARLTAELERSRRMDCLGRMAGSIAHDFNNLLSAMQTSLEAIASHPHDSERRTQALAAARAAAQRSQELTEQLLTFSRGGDVRAEPVDVEAVVREAISVTSLADTIDAAISPELPPVWVGRGQLHQVLQNLLLNARDALGPGGRIRVSAERAPGGVSIEVSDNGCGMTEEVRARVLEPFFTTKPAGSGLGLSTVYGIVQQAGGSIEVSSEPGEGSSFRLTLPEAPPQSQRRASDDGLPVNEGRRKVLICDDELRLAQLTAQLLDDHGYIGVIAGDARQAVDALLREQDLFAILLDVRLPLGGAERVLAELDDKGLELPVLLTSGFSRDDVAPELIGHPVVEAYIQKPFTVDSLVDVLQRLRSSAA